MKSLRLPAAAPSRQMNLLFDNSLEPPSRVGPVVRNQNFRRMLTSLMGQKSPIGGSLPAIW
jgi:hypothetical protein